MLFLPILESAVVSNPQVPGTYKKYLIEGASMSYTMLPDGNVLFQRITASSFTIDLYHLFFEKAHDEILWSSQQSLPAISLNCVLQGDIHFSSASLPERELTSGKSVLGYLCPGAYHISIRPGKHILCCFNYTPQHIEPYVELSPALAELSAAFQQCPEKEMAFCPTELSRSVKEMLSILLDNRFDSKLDRMMHAKAAADEALRSTLKLLQAAPPKEKCSPRKDQTIDRIRYFIVENPAEKYKVSELAQKFNLPEHVVKQGFKEKFKISVHNFQVLQKVELAKKLIAREDLLMVDVADQCGFYDLSHFTKMFRMYIGMSPGDYRKLSPAC